jgi:hypothetical protein
VVDRMMAFRSGRGWLRRSISFLPAPPSGDGTRFSTFGQLVNDPIGQGLFILWC